MIMIVILTLHGHLLKASEVPHGMDSTEACVTLMKDFGPIDERYVGMRNELNKSPVFYADETKPFECWVVGL